MTGANLIRYPFKLPSTSIYELAIGFANRADIASQKIQEGSYFKDLAVFNDKNWLLWILLAMYAKNGKVQQRKFLKKWFNKISE